MATSALDMTLDDVIKSKGNGSTKGRGEGRRGGGGGQNRKVGRTAADKKAAATGRSRPVAATKAVAAAAADGAAGQRRLRRVAPAAAIAPAAKAAAAAAKATATLASPAVRAGLATRRIGVAGPGEASEAPATRAAAPSAKAAQSAKGMEDKLAMSLEDMIKSEVRKRKPKADKPKAEKAGGGVEAAEGARAGRRGRRMKLRRENAAKATAKAKAKAKASRGRPGPRDDDDWRSGGGRDSGNYPSWSNARVSWESRRTPGSGLYSDWGASKGRSDDWSAPEPKRARGAGEGLRSDAGWGRSGGDAGWGAGSRAGSAGAWGNNGPSRPSERWSAGGDYWGGSSASCGASAALGWSRAGLGRAAADPAARRVTRQVREPAVDAPQWPATPARSGGGATSGGDRGGVTGRIRVSNVPKNLDWRDIKEAFEDQGRVTRCEVERGVAWITFENPLDAKKAVQTFDRGELNGQTIYVTHEN